MLSVDEDTTPEGVPDQYTFEPPESFNMDLLPEADLSAFMDVAKTAQLTQEQFQNVMNYYAEQTQASVDEAVSQWNNRVDGWRQAARTDTEIGGENFDANVQTALSVVKKFGDQDLNAMLRSPSEDNPDGLAISNNPAFLRFLNRIGKALGDPDFVMGDEQKQDSTDDARLARLYPSMSKQSA